MNFQYVVVQSVGGDDIVVSQHTSRESASKASKAWRGHDRSSHFCSLPIWYSHARTVPPAFGDIADIQEIGGRLKAFAKPPNVRVDKLEARVEELQQQVRQLLGREEHQ